MFVESAERKEQPSEVLFHGTTLERFNAFLQPDGSYRDYEGNPIWLDEGTTIPLMLARDYQKEHESDAVLLIVRSDMLSLQKPQNSVRRDGQILVPDYWITYNLPPKSFVSYNVTEDTMGLFNNTSLERHIEGLTRICEPLEALPSYIKVFSQR